MPCVTTNGVQVWVGAGICNGKYGGTAGIARVLAIVWVGVVVSDILTWSLGALARKGVLQTLKDRLFRCGPQLAAHLTRACLLIQ